jgi:hypothetical protein
VTGALLGLLRSARRPPCVGETRARSRALPAAAALLGIVAAAAGGELAGGAIRALGLAALLGAAAAAIAAGRRRSSPPSLVRLEERHLLARDAGVAVVTVAGQRFLVGFGASGVALLSRLRGGGPLPAPPLGWERAAREEEGEAP